MEFNFIKQREHSIPFLVGILFFSILLYCSSATAQQIPETNFWEKNIRMFNPPIDQAQWPIWRRNLEIWRAKEKKTANNVEYYKRGFEWVQSCFAIGFPNIYDTQFYNPKTNEYDVDAFVDHYKKEYGGLDAIEIWQLSPQIGFDDRNQYDFWRNMPGGLEGLRKAIDRFHARGVKVLINKNPWEDDYFHDDNLRPESGENPSGEPYSIAQIVRQINADGLFLNTYGHESDAVRIEFDKIKPGIVIEGEHELGTAKEVMKQHMEWYQSSFKDAEGLVEVPYYTAGGIIRNKWLERKHMVHMVQRNQKNHTEELRAAWMNGVGVIVWENVFGIWRGWCERDKSIIRSMLPVQRRYSLIFSGEGWTPMVPTMQSDLFASLWEREGLRLWTITNNSNSQKAGNVLKVGHRNGDRYFDLISGKEIQPEISNGIATLGCSINARGIAGFLAGPTLELGHDFNDFLLQQANIKARENLSTDYIPMPVSLTSVTPTKKYTATPIGMIAMKDTTYIQSDTITTRESGTYNNEILSDGGRTSKRVTFKPFAFDISPVTNAQFQQFMKSSGYSPRFKENFLKHWVNGIPPAGKENEPVVYVDLDDARAYAKWAGKRLPTKEEWQYAIESGKAYYGTSRVWEWNESERSDGRIRFCMLKGGCDWLARGSVFYAPGFIQLNKQNGHQKPDYSAKYILMYPGLDRLWTIGFRCAVDM